MLVAVNSNSKSAVKFEKKHPQDRNLQKASPKNKQISIKASPKTSNPQVFKKNRNSTKNNPKFARKPQGWQHWYALCVLIKPRVCS